MSDLSFLEKRALEKAFGMSSGYVLDFSNRTLQEFVADSTGKDIYDSAYDHGSGSKANRLRAFWREEPNAVVGKLLKGLSAYAVTLRNPPEGVAECERIADRLLSGSPDGSSTEMPPMTSDPPVARRDFFISHASEDKELVARPIADELQKRGYSVWIDEAELTLGDSLRREIDTALAACHFGVLVLSPMFFQKPWTQRELDGLVAKEMHGRSKCILPVWHKVDATTVYNYSPPLADKLGVPTSKGIDVVADAIVAAARKAGHTADQARTESQPRAVEAEAEPQSTPAEDKHPSLWPFGRTAWPKPETCEHCGAANALGDAVVLKSHAGYLTVHYPCTHCGLHVDTHEPWD